MACVPSLTRLTQRSPPSPLHEFPSWVLLLLYCSSGTAYCPPFLKCPILLTRWPDPPGTIRCSLKGFLFLSLPLKTNFSAFPSSADSPIASYRAVSSPLEFTFLDSVPLLQLSLSPQRYVSNFLSSNVFLLLIDSFSKPPLFGISQTRSTLSLKVSHSAFSFFFP